MTAAPAQSYGWIAPLITTVGNVTTLIFQERMAARQHKIERHRREREQAAAEAERQRQAAAAKAEAEAQAQLVQAQIAANATGGAVAVDAHGRPIPASGVAAMSVGRGGNTMLMLGGAAVAAVVLFMVVGRR